MSKVWVGNVNPDAQERDIEDAVSAPGGHAGRHIPPWIPP
jgi:hypothetical protein